MTKKTGDSEGVPRLLRRFSWQIIPPNEIQRPGCYRREVIDRRVSPYDWAHSVIAAGGWTGCACRSCQETVTQACRDEAALGGRCPCPVCGAARRGQPFGESSPRWTLTATHLATELTQSTELDVQPTTLDMKRLAEAMRPAITRRRAALARAPKPEVVGTIRWEGYSIPKTELPSDWKRILVNQGTLSPIGPERCVGIEIECGTVGGPHSTRLQIIQWGLAHRVRAGSDGSVRVAGRDDTELRLCVRQSELERIVTKTCDMLQSDVLDAKVNTTCGLHVHLDARGRNETTSERPPGVYQSRYRDETYQRKLRMYRRLFRLMPWLYAVQPESRRTDKHGYCSRNCDIDWSDDSSDHGRYCAINLDTGSKPTVEVRLGAGTVEANKILYWVELLQAIAYGPRLSSCPRSLGELSAALDLRPELVAWIRRRARATGGHRVENLTLGRATLTAEQLPLDLAASA